MNGTYLPAWRLWVTTASGGLHAKKSNEQCLNQESGISIPGTSRPGGPSGRRSQHLSTAVWALQTTTGVNRHGSSMEVVHTCLEAKVSYDDLTGFDRLRC